MSYLHLFIAILGELLGTNLLKLSDGFTKPIPTLSALLSYGVCFYFLSLAMRKNSFRSNLCNMVSCRFSFDSLYLSNDFQSYSIIGLILIIIGVVMVNLLGNAGH